MKTKKVGHVIEKTERGMVLMFDGIQKEYAESTINRWWRPVSDEATNPEANKKPAKKKVTQLALSVIEAKQPTQPTPRRTPAAAQTTQPGELPEHTTDLAKILLARAEQLGASFKSTSSYLGVRVDKRTAVEIHSSKRGKTKVVINAKCLDDSIRQDLFDAGVAKLAPESYGWTLNMTVQLDSLTTDMAEHLVEASLSYLGLPVFTA